MQQQSAHTAVALCVRSASESTSSPRIACSQACADALAKADRAMNLVLTNHIQGARITAYYLYILGRYIRRSRHLWLHPLPTYARCSSDGRGVRYCAYCVRLLVSPSRQDRLTCKGDLTHRWSLYLLKGVLILGKPEAGARSTLELLLIERSRARRLV
jgi:hypothetical protein